MKTSLVAVTLFSLSALAAIPAAAQTMKPGLWEIKSSLGKDYGKSMAALAANNKKMVAAMSPEARKEMAAIEAETAGQMQYTDDHVISKACITKDQANAINKMWRQQGNCTYQNSPFVGGAMKLQVSCTKPQSTGTGSLRFQGDSSFNMEMTATTTMQGQRFTNQISAAGKWLGANCGTIEPDTEQD